MQLLRVHAVLICILIAAALAASPSRGAFVATAYTAAPGAVTASGIPASPWGQVKLMAIDPRGPLAMGRCYVVQFRDGHRSTYLAADTGAAIRGRRVDLLLRTRAGALRFGRQNVTINGPVACTVAK